ncbi:unnamed protein product, partial [Chrysoparadoxa australica]
TRSSNALPSGDDHITECTINPSYDARSAGAGQKVLTLMQTLADHVQLDHSLDTAQVEDAVDPEVFESVTDVVELLLEEVDGYFDEATGQDSSCQVALMKDQIGAGATKKKKPQRLADVPKPQLAFMDQIDNSRGNAFVPRLREKPNAVISLDLTPVAVDHMGKGREGKRRDLASGNWIVHYPHPYEAEIRAFHYQPWQLQAPAADSVAVPSSLEVTEDNPWPKKAEFICTEDAFDKMVASLEGVCEMAIDLENHSIRSYQGVSCLMQLTARSGPGTDGNTSAGSQPEPKDYVIDTLALRRVMFKLLPVFTDPKIVKVLHGSDSDVLWLQRDFGLYLLNVFDTGQAARQLGLASFGYAHLLELYCGFTPDKKHQLSDWRQRPLPDDMLLYAQMDTHYLLYAYDRLRQDLAAMHERDPTSGIRAVLDASREICLRRYDKPIFQEDGWVTALSRHGGNVLTGMTREQKRVASALWNWRDTVAREADESPGYIISLYVLARVARTMPVTVASLMSCGNPVTEAVHERAQEILDLVKAARAGDTQVSALDDHALPQQLGPHSRNVFNPVVTNAGPYFRPFNFTPSSVARFVSASMRGNEAGGDGIHEAPVLNTEEMYRTAGWWVQPRPKNNKGGMVAAIRVSRLAHGNAQYNTATRMGHSMSLASEVITLRAFILHTHHTATASSHHFFALNSGAKAQRIRDEIAREPVLSLANVAGFGVEAIGNDAEKQKGEGGDAGAGALSGGEGEGDGDGDGDPGIPRSMAEIYKISNRNRKRNKEKKKLREVSQGDAEITKTMTDGDGSKAMDEGDDNGTGAEAGTAHVAAYFAGRKKLKGEGGEGQRLGDTVAFMEGLDWVGEEEKQEILAQQQVGGISHSGGEGGSSASQDQPGAGSAEAWYGGPRGQPGRERPVQGHPNRSAAHGHGGGKRYGGGGAGGGGRGFRSHDYGPQTSGVGAMGPGAQQGVFNPYVSGRRQSGGK